MSRKTLLMLCCINIISCGLVKWIKANNTKRLYCQPVATFMYTQNCTWYNVNIFEPTRYIQSASALNVILETALFNHKKLIRKSNFCVLILEFLCILYQISLTGAETIEMDMYSYNPRLKYCIMLNKYFHPEGECPVFNVKG
jgi:hypothetical protein